MPKHAGFLLVNKNLIIQKLETGFYQQVTVNACTFIKCLLDASKLTIFCKLLLLPCKLETKEDWKVYLAKTMPNMGLMTGLFQEKMWIAITRAPISRRSTS